MSLPRDAISALVAFAGNPTAMSFLRELEKVHVQARAAGVKDQFDAAWAYESARFKSFPGAMLEPRQVLQLVLETVI